MTITAPILGGARAFAIVKFNQPPTRAAAYACGFVQFVHRHTAEMGIDQMQDIRLATHGGEVRRARFVLVSVFGVGC